MYGVVVYPDAQDQADALPAEALKYYFEALDVLELGSTHHHHPVG